MGDSSGLQVRKLLWGVGLVLLLNGLVALGAVWWAGFSLLAFQIVLLASSLMIALAFAWQWRRERRNRHSHDLLNQSLQDALRELHHQIENDHKELEMARKVHEGLLSLNDPQIPGIHIASRCIPAQNLGGDFYAYLERHGDGFLKKSATQTGVVEYLGRNETMLGVIIGDVAGHGVSSALVMALSNGLMTEMGKNTRLPGQLLTQSNERIYHYIHTSNIRYLTAFYGILSVESGVFRYAKAGHVCPYVLRQDGSIEVLESEGIFLGMYPQESYEEKHCELAPGDRLVLFTDGVTELRNPQGEMLGEERLKALVAQYRFLPVAEAIEKVFRSLQEFSRDAPARDDQTLVIIEYRPETP